MTATATHTSSRSRAATNAGLLAVRRLPALGLVALVLALLAVLTPAPQAEAYHYVNYRRPGAVAIPTVIGTHVYTCADCGWQPAIQVPAFTVGRSPANRRAQTFDLTYAVQHYDGSQWQLQTSRSVSGSIAARQPRVLVGEQFIVPNRAHYLRVSFVVRWRDQRTGRVLGTFVATLDQRDYRCQTGYPCVAGDGWVWLRMN